MSAAPPPADHDDGMLRAWSAGASSPVGNVFITVEELAAELRTTPDTVHFWHRMQKGPPSVKVGRRRLFARSDVDAWLQQQRG